jgi:hypothetical protein
MFKGKSNDIIKMNAKRLQDKGMSESDAMSKSLKHANKGKKSFDGKIGRVTKKITKSKSSDINEDDIGTQV